MKTLHLKNPTADAQLSFVLSELMDTLKNQGAQVEAKQKSDNTKGSLVLEVVIVLGEGIVANAIYDLLKYSLNRLGDRLAGKTPLEIDDRITTVDEVRKDS